jgi:hypothetical protein
LWLGKEGIHCCAQVTRLQISMPPLTGASTN